jgi:hypothetical protein
VSIRVHAVAASRGDVFDIAQAERATSVLIPLELSDGCLSCCLTVKTDDAGSSRASTRLILDLGLLDFAYRGE